ncbi:MAG: HAMP domain-containing histidine kinase [Lachnospiraceae bacterium]|nr:HAMP domain-containing histidine kinase [Lachnospiraceae bacterium]
MFRNKDFKQIIIVGSIVTAVLSIIVLNLNAWAGLATLLLGGFLILFFSFYTKKRYEDIENLNEYLTKVLSGDDSTEIFDQQEGEISILKSNIYKTTTTLKYQKEMLSKDKKRMADAIANISHQLKTPLTSMMVMNDLLKDEEDKEKQKEFLSTQSNQLDRMNWLIQTLLKLSKIDAGTVSMKKETISLSSLLKEVIRPFEIQMDLKNIKYVDKSTDFTISCDKNWTIEAIQNIVKNCIEHMDEGGALTIASSDTNIYSEISVSDTGSGISEEDLAHIFERFYKGKNAGKDSVGIGLSLSKSIIESQKGDILVSSKEGEGTTFVIKFFKTII